MRNHKKKIPKEIIINKKQNKIMNKNKMRIMNRIKVNKVQILKIYDLCN